MNTNQYHVTIRDRAKYIYRKSELPKKCIICGYDKHYHICHIKDIKDFGDDAKLSIVNVLENLVALCPTHHWEFDHDMLDKKDKRKLENYIKNGPMV